MLPVGAAGIVVGAVALLEAGFAEFEEVEAVFLVLGAFLGGQLMGVLPSRTSTVVFLFDVDVEHAVEVVWSLPPSDFDRALVDRVVVDAEGQLDLAHFGDRRCW